MSIRDFLLAEDRGVSPVIGVILMVAITVILAAVIATFVMNMGPPETTAPSASFSWNNGTNWVSVTHDGGDAVKKSNLKLKVSGSEKDIPSTTASKITATDSINKTSLSTTPPTSAQLIWMNPNSDQTQVLSEWEA